jgi:hypothetical protein
LPQNKEADPAAWRRQFAVRPGGRRGAGHRLDQVPDQLLEVDAGARTALVQPGIVLDALNAELRKHGLWFPVDVSTSAQATLGGMAGNNPAARARSPTATWCTTSSPSTQ